MLWKNYDAYANYKQNKEVSNLWKLISPQKMISTINVMKGSILVLIIFFKINDFFWEIFISKNLIFEGMSNGHMVFVVKLVGGMKFQSPISKANSTNIINKKYLWYILCFVM